MFWGLIMEPRRRYSQIVQKAFHISMASLDITSSDTKATQVILTYDGRNYLLCTLKNNLCIQTPLDLNFNEGDEISFATNGNSHVHLTGYLLDDPDETEDEDEDNETAEPTKNRKRRKASIDEGTEIKKSKTAELLEAVGSDSDSDDMNFSDILKNAGEESSDDENLHEEDEESDEEDDDDDDEDIDEEEDDEIDDEEEEASSLSEDEIETKPVKQNGVSPSKKKEKNQKEQEKKSKNKPTEKQEKSPQTDKNKVKNQDKTPKNQDKTPKNQDKTPKNKTPLEKKVLEGGVQIHDLVVGNGPIAKPGRFVQVYYEGKLKSNNKIFDSTKQGNGFKFRLGGQEVIKGWDVGIQGMKVGGKRRITCPPMMAYGQKGSPPTIPANATLVFDVELKNVH